MKKIICDVCGNDGGKELRLVVIRSGVQYLDESTEYPVDMCVGCAVSLAEAWQIIGGNIKFALKTRKQYNWAFRDEWNKAIHDMSNDEKIQEVKQLSLDDTGFTEFVGRLLTKGFIWEL